MGFSLLNTLIRDVTEAMENYDVLGATRPIEGFVDQLSNWYLRRSRRRISGKVNRMGINLLLMLHYMKHLKPSVCF